MSWLRYDDQWTTDRAWDAVGYDARWHYITMVEDCSRARRWDGRLPLTRARRASDVDDPDKCIDELAANGWVRIEADTVVILCIDQHVPPEGQRDENLLPRKARNVADYRRRRCEEGLHTKDCPPATCPAKLARKTARVTPRVTGYAGTGRVGSGKPQQRTDIGGGAAERDGDGEPPDDPWLYSTAIGETA